MLSKLNLLVFWLHLTGMVVFSARISSKGNIEENGKSAQSYVPVVVKSSVDEYHNDQNKIARISSKGNIEENGKSAQSYVPVVVKSSDDEYHNDRNKITVINTDCPHQKKHKKKWILLKRKKKKSNSKEEHNPKYSIVLYQIQVYPPPLQPKYTNNKLSNPCHDDFGNNYCTPATSLYNHDPNDNTNNESHNILNDKPEVDWLDTESDPNKPMGLISNSYHPDEGWFS